MSPFADTLDEQLYSLFAQIAETGIRHAARGLSSMVGETLTVSRPTIELMPLFEIPELLGGPEKEAVGIYLRSDGMLAGQFMLLMPVPKAMELVDLMMDLPCGSTTSLGALERSALAELGNLTGTFFLNAVSAVMNLESRPTPPAVVVDMVGAILDILLLAWDGLSENVLMLKADFIRGEREMMVDFWVIPERSTLDAIRQREQHG